MWPDSNWSELALTHWGGSDWRHFSLQPLSAAGSDSVCVRWVMFQDKEAKPEFLLLFHPQRSSVCAPRVKGERNRSPNSKEASTQIHWGKNWYYLLRVIGWVYHSWEPKRKIKSSREWKGAKRIAHDRTQNWSVLTICHLPQVETSHSDDSMLAISSIEAEVTVQNVACRLRFCQKVVHESLILNTNSGTGD